MIDHKKLRKGVTLTIGLGSLVKKSLDKELGKIYGKGHITKAKQIQITKKIVKRAMSEGRKIENIVVSEAIKELKSATANLEKAGRSRKKPSVKK